MRTPRQIIAFRLLLVCSLACALGGCGKQDAKSGARKKDGKSAVSAGSPGPGGWSIAAQPGSRLLKLEVRDGQKVKAGDALAYLETHPLRLAEREAAEVALKEARERLVAETAYAEAIIEQGPRRRGCARTFG